MNKNLIVTVAVIAALAISLCFTAVMYYNETQKSNELTEYKNNRSYWQLLEKITADNRNSTLSQPIPMENALSIAFERTGWTENTLMELNATRVDVKLVYGYTTSNTTVIQNAVTAPVIDYSPVTQDGVIYRYMWQIVAYNASSDLMPLTHEGYCLVDAATGEILPIPQSGV